MDRRRFDDLASQLASGLSRRHGLGVLAVLGLGAGVLIDDAEAKKHKRRKKQKKVKRNSFGCVNVGSFCKSGGQCCSGICTGSKGKATCQAHDQATCSGQDSVCRGEAVDPDCTTSTGEDGLCGVTTGNGRYCTAGAASVCLACKTDADCVPQCGTGAACLSCAACLEGFGVQTACASLTTLGCGPI